MGPLTPAERQALAWFDAIRTQLERGDDHANILRSVRHADREVRDLIATPPAAQRRPVSMMSSDERINDLRAMHFSVEEPDYGTMDPDPPLVSVCYEDGTTWPCDTGMLLTALAASQARERALAEALEMERDLVQAIIDEKHDTGELPRRWWLERVKHMSAALRGQEPADATPAQDEMIPCPNGCFGEWGEGSYGQPVPKYCGANGCDAESPGMIYRE